MVSVSRPEDARGALLHLNNALHRLRAQANEPSLRMIAAEAGVATTTVHRLFSVAELPRIRLVLSVVEVLAKRCRNVTNVDDVLDRFDRLWQCALNEQIPPPPPWPGEGPIWPGDDPMPAWPGPGPRGPLPLGAGGVPVRPNPPLELGQRPIPPDRAADGRDSPALFVAGLPALGARVEFAYVSGSVASLGKSELVTRLLWELLQEERDTVIIGISGRVVRDAQSGEVLFVMADTEIDGSGRVWNAFAYRELQFAIARSSARRCVLLVDAVISGPAKPPSGGRRAWLEADTSVWTSATADRDVSTPAGKQLYVLFGFRSESQPRPLAEQMLELLRESYREGDPRSMGQLHGDLVRAALYDGRPIPYGVSYNGGRDIAAPLMEPGSVRGRVLAIGLAGDGRIATANDDGAVRVWDADGRLVRGFPVSNGPRIRDIALSADGSIAVADDDGLRVWDAAGVEIVQWALTVALTCVAFSAHGNKVVAGGDDGSVRVWDLVGEVQTPALTAFPSPVLSVAMGSAGQVVAASADRMVRVWEAGTVREWPFPASVEFDPTAPVGRSLVCVVAFVGADPWLVASSDDGMVWASSPSAGAPDHQWTHGPAGVAVIAMAPHGLVATADRYGNRRWYHELVRNAD